MVLYPCLPAEQAIYIYVGVKLTRQTAVRVISLFIRGLSAVYPWFIAVYPPFIRYLTAVYPLFNRGLSVVYFSVYP